MALPSRRVLAAGLVGVVLIGFAGTLAWQRWFETMPAALRSAVMESPDSAYSRYRNRPFRLRPDTVICREPIEYIHASEVRGGEAVVRQALARFEGTMAVLAAGRGRCTGNRGQVNVRLIVNRDYLRPRLVVSLAAWQRAAPGSRGEGEGDALWYAVRTYWGPDPMPDALDADAQGLAQELAWQLGTEPRPAPQPDPVAMARLRQPRPAGNPGKWVTAADYPPQAIRDGDQGTVAVRLAVRSDGRAGDCTVISSSGSPVLDETACRLLVRRARFRPALDPDGNPVAGSYVSRVRWQRPEQAGPTR